LTRVSITLVLKEDAAILQKLLNFHVCPLYKQ
jgi:hypothetical protein